MQAAFPAAFCFCAIGLLWLPTPALSQSSLTIDDEVELSHRAIESALMKRGSIAFAETPLQDAMADIGRQFQIPIVLAKKKLDQASVSPDTPVTMQLNGLTLESILSLVLRELELDFAIRNEVLLITTPEDVESQLEARTYPVLDLVFSRTAGSKVFVGADYDALIELITTTIKPDSWDDVGGPGAVDQLDNAGCLVISQTLTNHRQIERLLLSLRRAKSIQGIASLPLPTSVSRRSYPMDPPHTSVRNSAPVGHNWQLPQVHD
jgi:hypothetical protein